MELPKRKPTRLKDFDYSKNGTYFITICTHNRSHILSTIVGEGSPLPQLSKYGDIADRWIRKIPEKYPPISVDRYVIMPNHIHLLLSAVTDDGRGNPSPTVDAVIGWLKYQITKEINQMRDAVGSKVFQRSFHDHIVRGEADYREIWAYIDTNPDKWETDSLFSPT